MKREAALKILTAMLVCSVPHLFAQPISPDTDKQAPAQVVLVFLSEPTEFQAIEMDGSAFGSLSMPADFAGVWPVSPGNRKLIVKAPEAADAQVSLQLDAGQTALVFLGFEKAVGDAPAKIQVKALAPRLPRPSAGTKKIYAFVAPNSQPVRGKLMRGEEKFTDVQLAPGKLELLGEGATVLKVGDQVVISGDPASSGNYVFVLVPDGAKSVRTVAFSEIVPDPQPQSP
jgi:hypothetical protein